MNVKTMTIAFLQKKLFKKEYERLEREEKIFEEYKEETLTAMNNPKNWIEHIVSVYGPFPQLEDFNTVINDYVYEIVKDKNNEYEKPEDFFAEIKPVLDNKALRLILKYMMNEQIHYIAMQSTPEDADFSRASLNGFLKVERVLDEVMGQLNQYVIDKKAEGMTTDEIYKLLS